VSAPAIKEEAAVSAAAENEIITETIVVEGQMMQTTETEISIEAVGVLVPDPNLLTVLGITAHQVGTDLAIVMIATMRDATVNHVVSEKEEVVVLVDVMDDAEVGVEASPVARALHSMKMNGIVELCLFSSLPLVFVRKNSLAFSKRLDQLKRHRLSRIASVDAPKGKFSSLFRLELTCIVWDMLNSKMRNPFHLRSSSLAKSC
jgi:hypothetical protein